MSDGHNASRAPRVRKAPNRIPTTVSDSSAAALTAYIDRITELCPHLPASVPEGTLDSSPDTIDGKIYRVVHHVFGVDSKAPADTFTRRMDVLFGTDCGDTEGRFHHVRRGPYGMILFAKYLRTIKWATDGIPLTTAALKLAEVAKEMEVLCHQPHPPIGPSPSAASTSGSKRAAGEASSEDKDGPSMKRRNIHQTCNGTVTVEDEDEDEFPSSIPPPAKSQIPSRASNIELVVPSKPRKNSSGNKSSLSLGDKKVVYLQTKKSHVTPPPSGSDPTPVGDDDLLLDIDIAEIAVSETVDTTADLKKFFHPATRQLNFIGSAKFA
ncbi:hypothetical protein DFH08DRAFT_398527 [Mycena albidolilacea]|uniref:Uncharacterized protein n=1 Tax=Mycena albidolilacea TaxID=1033008 RepID=A0AAD6ZDJ9_9AGAR|nr:hypothetical protein DFH08DRAFT_398527 [Mycena albidolilacea]